LIFLVVLAFGKLICFSQLNWQYCFANK